MSDKDDYSWEGKTALPVGINLDGPLPTLTYFVMGQNVYTRLAWPDGTTTRGVIPRADLEERFGTSGLKDGFYNALGDYLGETLLAAEQQQTSDLSEG